MKLPKITPKKKERLTVSELRALADACGKYRTIVLFLDTCGLRMNETFALRVEDFDLVAKIVRVEQSWTTDENGKKLRDENGEFTPGSTKTGEGRVVPLEANTIDLIKPLLTGKAPSRLGFRWSKWSSLGLWVLSSFVL